ncbi:SseB family protein [Solwaraspora sp. WMMD792]|uniref:SseB family protein n=1 Tax=Solwaraspora sp. WMMD792 TaxID=3016099 RepID=UPI002417C112|nr:SseB family protein [Solwaraspora sp. WMMD792]MDG4774426.1 SseB family protein [Solwaraspora sp. WMMD792]
MTDWQPATEIEAAMRDALLRQDQELYFQLLAGTELLLPVSAQALAGQAPMGWGTWTTNGRTHVLAFTSPVTLHACLGDSGSSARRVTFAELAATWPNLEWWLAVNPGLPIEGWLPAWFVAQLARGDARLPNRGGQSEGRADAAARARATATVPGPAGHPGGAGPVDGGPVDGGPALLPDHGRHPTRYAAEATAAASPPPAPAAPAPTAPAPEGQWPHPDNAAVDPAPPTASPVPPGSPPPYGSTRSPAGATAGLSAGGLPRRVPTPAPPTEDPPPAAEQRGAAGDTVVGPAFEPASGPAFEPASGPALEPASGPAFEPDVDPPSGPVVEEPPSGPAFEPANDVERDLVAAAGGGGSNSFLSTLLLAKVLLPVSESSVAGSRPGDEGFTWRTETATDGTFVVVFTSPERIADHFDTPVETVEVKFVQLIRRWPDPQWSFVINPGTPVGAKLPGTEIVGLASWAAEVGLGDEEADVEQPAEPQPGGSAAPKPAVSSGPDVPGQPTTMQKTVAASQVGYYLDRGYDRVSGFVHRAAEVAHLDTPAKLYAALGLGYAGSPFAPDAEEIFVLRWPAYRPSLYRIPYGGQNENAMRAMEGWVIERPPFRGNGFAPGESSDVVAEFKVDGIRLPHGSQLWRLGADGTGTLVARLDADETAWQRVKEE